MEEYFEHFDYNFQKEHNIYPSKTLFKNHNYETIIKNPFCTEKFSYSSDDERSKDYIPTQKSTKVFNEIFNINNQNNSLEINQMFNGVENPDNFSNNNELNNTLQNIGQNNSSKENENNSNSNMNEFHSGRWTNEEHNKFIEGILKYGNEWKKVQNIIKTRSSTQARSHAQKFFLRLKKIVNQETSNDPDKLLNYIINSCDKPRNSFSISNEQKEKLMSVIRANLKSEEYSNKYEKDFLMVNNKTNSLNEKNESGFDDFNEEEDNLGYNKQIENEEFGFKKKMSCDLEEKKRKLTFCSRKRKSSSDISIAHSFNKIFTITKDKSHKHSMDISKNKNIFVSNLQPKDNIEKNNNFYPKKFNINHNFIINKITKINTNDNFKKIQNMKNQINSNDFNIKNGNIFIQNNIYNIYNTFTKEVNPKNNINDIKCNQNIFVNNSNMNNNKINNYQNTSLRTVIFNPDIKTLKKYKKQNNQNNSNVNENEKTNKNYIVNNQNIFPYNSNQEKNNKTYCENEQYNPFNLEFENFSSNENKLLNDYYDYNNHFFQINEQMCSISDRTNNLYINE